MTWLYGAVWGAISGLLSIVLGLFTYAFPPEDHPLLRVLAAVGFWISFAAFLFLIGYLIRHRGDRASDRAGTATLQDSEVIGGNLQIDSMADYLSRRSRMKNLKGRFRHDPR